MADRGLSPAAITELGSNSVEIYQLLRLDFSTPLYYTSAPYDISHGGNTYLSSGIFDGVPSIKESLAIKPNKVPVQLSGVAISIHAILLLEPKNVPVYIYGYIVGVGEVFTLFQGFTDSYKAIEDIAKRKSDIKLNVNNHWSDWDSKAGRYISHEAQQELYVGDLGLEYSAVTNNVEEFWGTRPLPQNNAGLQDLLDGSYITEDRYNAIVDFWSSGFYDKQPEPLRVKLPIVYGQGSIKGTPVFKSVSGTAGSDLWVVYALSEGECDSLVDIRINGVSYTDAQYSSNVFAYFKSGTTTQTVETNIDAASTEWTANHRLRGICYVVVKYVFNKDIFASEPVPDFILKGKKLYDPRIGGAPVYSSNNALCLYDYLTNTVYGKQIPASNLAGFNAGATLCDTTNIDHDGGLGGGQVSIKLFEMNGLLDLGASIKDNVEKILFTMRAHLPWVDEKYTLVIEQTGETSVYSFDETNVTGKFEQGESGVNSLSNTVYYNFLDAELNYIDGDVITSSSAFLAEDNGKILRKDIRNRYETNRYRAKIRSETELKKTRENIDVKLTASMADAVIVETGQIVDITRESKGWTAKLFRVSDMDIRKDGSIMFGLKEYESATYNWLVSVETAPKPDTELINPFYVLPPTNLALNSGTSVLILNGDGTITSRIKVTFTVPDDVTIAGYNVYLKEGTGAKLFNQRINGRDTNEIYISPVEDGISYTVYVHSVNGIEVESTAASLVHVVLGKSAAPADVTGFMSSQNGGVVVLKWTQVADLDLAGYDIRFGTRGLSSWEDGTPLTSVTRGTNVTSADITTGDWTFYIKAVDTSGNYSVNAAEHNSRVVSAADAISQTPSSPDWAGTKTNFVVHYTGALVPTSQDADSDDGATIWDDDTIFSEFVHNVYPVCTYESDEIDIGYDDDVRVWGSIDSALGYGETGIAAPVLEIDYISRDSDQTCKTIVSVVASGSLALVTVTGHGYPDGEHIELKNTTCNPSVDGWHEITYVGANTFTIPIEILDSGTGGSSCISIYDGFEAWGIGNLTLRLCKHKLTLTNSVGKAYIANFLPTVDQIEHTDTVNNLLILAGGSTVIFDPPFHNPPFVKAFVVSTGAFYAVVSAVTATTFFVIIYNSSGVSVSGNINYQATGV